MIFDFKFINYEQTNLKEFGLTMKMLENNITKYYTNLKNLIHFNNKEYILIGKIINKVFYYLN